MKDRNRGYNCYLRSVSAPGYKGAVRVFSEGGQSEADSEADTTSQPKEDQSAVLDQASVDELRLGESYKGEHSNFRLLEVGCGTGSTVFPILEMNTRPDLMVYCCDLSQVT